MVNIKRITQAHAFELIVNTKRVTQAHQEFTQAHQEQSNDVNICTYFAAIALPGVG